MKPILFIGLVFVIHHVNGGCLGCSSCHGSYGSYVEEHRHGCGLQFPINKACGKIELPHSDWCDDREKDCVPLVVRPQDIPKPTLNPAVAVDLAKIVANPCAVKKAIVKPAVLPKPVCKASGQGYGVGYGVGYGAGCGCGVGCGQVEQSCCGSLHGAGPCYGSGFCGVIGPNGVPFLAGGVAGAGGVVGVAGVPGGVLGVPGGQFGRFGPYGTGPLAPADVVSLDIANKLAREANLRNVQVEDRLNFGFRKLPVELPPKKVVHSNVPEEAIFHVNGAVVELKPIVSSAGSSPAALAEEAAEQLLALEEEEANADANVGAIGTELQPGIRRISLSEIGYGLAAPPKPNLITVPDSTASVGAQDISTNCGCGNYAHGCGCVSSCGSCGNKCDCKIIPGNVEIEIKPKPQQICLPIPEFPDACESAEIEISEENGSGGITCSCVPVCMHHQKHCNCKKTCYTVEKVFG